MKLQVGCSEVTGRYKSEEWINLDIIKHDGCNVIGSGSNLPFRTGAVDAVHCVHVLEHVTRDKYKGMLQEMCRVLKPGGHCYVETPDFKGTVENLMRAFQTNDVNGIHIWTTSIYGKNERLGMAHHWGFYEGLLKNKMREVGFKDVVRLTGRDEMISTHYKQEPVLLLVGIK